MATESRMPDKATDSTRANLKHWRPERPLDFEHSAYERASNRSGLRVATKTALAEAPEWGQRGQNGAAGARMGP